MTYRANARLKPESPEDDRKILVVEDSRTFSMALRHYLDAETGLPITVCRSLNELNETIENEPDGYAIAVIDLNLPDAPNGEALDCAVKRGIPAIVFTASFDLATRNAIMEREVIDYVLKDSEFALGNLVASVKRALANRDTRILVVDDMTSTRKVLTHMLTIQRYTVVEAASGVEAIAILEKNPDIQLVVTDYNMPDIDGYELTRRIRRRFPSDKVRVIGVSSSTDRTVSAGFLKAGANDFISRPFVPEELQCRIASNAETLTQMKQLHDLASRDFLTGLFNRRYFFGNASKEIKEARQKDKPCSVAILDIDHFKRLNDSFGHEVGDQALKLVSKCLQQSIAGTDALLARLGGEEFAILFPGVARPAAAQLADHIRLDISHLELTVGDETVAMTVSIGVADVAGQESFDHYLNIADHQLYAAKQQGRNRVCSDEA